MFKKFVAFMGVAIMLMQFALPVFAQTPDSVPVVEPEAVVSSDEGAVVPSDEPEEDVDLLAQVPLASPTSITLTSATATDMELAAEGGVRYTIVDSNASGRIAAYEIEIYKNGVYEFTYNTFNNARTGVLSATYLSGNSLGAGDKITAKVKAISTTANGGISNNSVLSDESAE